MSKVSLIIGFLSGAIVGAGVALLLAPESGAETRRVIRERTGEAIDKGKQVATDVAHKGKQVATDLADKGRDFVESHMPAKKS